jgi:cytochrome c oxidase assembly protein subunit 15
MATGSKTGRITITRRHRTLLLTAAVMTYLLVTLGGIVCVTDSSRGCPDWPACYGKIVPPMRTDAIIESLHRFLAALTSGVIVAAAIVGWRRSRSIRLVSWPPLIAVALLLAVIVFGALVVLRGLSPGMAAVDLGSALMVLALMLMASVAAFSLHENPALPDLLSFRSSFAKLTLWTLVAVFIVLVSGVLVADTDSPVRCLGWPLYSGRLIPVDPRGWLQLARRLVGAVASILVIAVVVQAWRTQRGQTAILRAATVVGVLLVAETMVGALMAAGGLGVLLMVIYVAMTAALWALLVVLAVLAGLASPPSQRSISSSGD